jgi:tRNA-specific 2-thiouridylase
VFGAPEVRVVAALSGGVDSAVAAARMVDAGHDVTAVHLALSRTPTVTRVGSRGCCSLEDSRDARRVADVLDVPFYVWDLSERFQADVVDDFVAEYAAGRTPNPCLRCNERIKFSAVLDRAVALGFDAVATGHYARTTTGADGSVTLHRAADAAKDQSYVLAVLDQRQLRHSAFPLGHHQKSEVRAEAAARGLLVADKPDSHDICFIPDGDTAGYLSRTLGPAPGEVVDAVTGTAVGRHDGAYAFTVGQRKGLHLDHPAPDGRPRYVLSLSPATRTVTVGDRDALAVDGFDTSPPVWCSGRAEAGDQPRTVLVQYRAHGEPVQARIRVAGPEGGLSVTTAARQVGVAPGQAAAFYDGDRVLGSATIAGTWRH